MRVGASPAVLSFISCSTLSPAISPALRTLRLSAWLKKVGTVITASLIGCSTSRPVTSNQRASHVKPQSQSRQTMVSVTSNHRVSHIKPQSQSHQTTVSVTSNHSVSQSGSVTSNHRASHIKPHGQSHQTTGSVTSNHSVSHIKPQGQSLHSSYPL